MPTLQNMLETHPRLAADRAGNFGAAVEALALCEQACLVCADACLNEESPAELRECIQYNLDCAAICHATAGVLLRRAEGPGAVLHAQLHACVTACQACGDACAMHARQHPHCTVCADICRACQEACNEALGVLAPTESVTST